MPHACLPATAARRCHLTPPHALHGHIVGWCRRRLPRLVPSSLAHWGVHLHPRQPAPHVGDSPPEAQPRVWPRRYNCWPSPQEPPHRAALTCQGLARVAGAQHRPAARPAPAPVGRPVPPLAFLRPLSTFHAPTRHQNNGPRPTFDDVPSGACLGLLARRVGAFSRRGGSQNILLTFNQ